MCIRVALHAARAKFKEMVDDSLFPAKITFMLGFDVICVICL